jgi:hypothetical protein
MKLLTTFVLAIGCASVLATQAQAQSDKIKTTIKTDDAKAVTYTGCVQTGSQAKTYVLDRVQPVRKTTEFNTDGSTTTTTTYSIVSDTAVQLEPQVGHRVEVQGVLIPAGHGDASIKTKTEVNGKETRSKTEIDKTSMPQLRVISVKSLGESCSVN